MDIHSVHCVSHQEGKLIFAVPESRITRTKYPSTLIVDYASVATLYGLG